MYFDIEVPRDRYNRHADSRCPQERNAQWFSRHYLTSLLTRTAENDMQLNTSKTKEMLLGRLNPVNTPLLSTPAGTVQRVDTFKLLGVHLMQI